MTTQNRNEIEHNNRIIATSSSLPNNGAAVALPGSTAFEDEDTNCKPFNSWISRYRVLERKLCMLTALVPLCFLGSARPLYARKYTREKTTKKRNDDDNKRQ